LLPEEVAVAVTMAVRVVVLADYFKDMLESRPDLLIM
jgi:hypothetical protein